MGMKGKIALNAVVGVVVLGVVSANAGSDKDCGSDSSGKRSAAPAVNRPHGKTDSGDASAAEKFKTAGCGDRKKP
ncbi:hypothetical protein [Streptomyces sp. NPDC101165]|uniref:hypothetical protein n=1 Tax=Streptomyces sp. NPDC101165 TaxID=3366119 RepID=UPI00380D2123